MVSWGEAEVQVEGEARGADCLSRRETSFMGVSGVEALGLRDSDTVSVHGPVISDR